MASQPNPEMDAFNRTIDHLLSVPREEMLRRLESANHAIEYVNENVHANTMENFWSLVKRQIRGTYINVDLWNPTHKD